ncbi:MAG TPA: hypothetical protein DCM73_12050 [Clostridiales bacterium]|nr:hypothetical protein [Clostridiales bacterium]
MSVSFKKYFITIFVLLIFVLCLTYCILTSSSENIFSMLVENNGNIENDGMYDKYILLKSSANILERVIFVLYKIFFVSMCFIYAYKENKYFKTIIYSFCSTLIYLIIAAFFTEKVGYMNYLFPAIVNSIYGIIISIVLVILIYSYNKIKYNNCQRIDK